MVPVRQSTAGGGESGVSLREAEKERRPGLFIFSFIYKYLLSIYYAPGAVFPRGDYRRGLSLIGLWVIKIYHKLVETGKEMHWLRKLEHLGGLLASGLP